MDLLSVLGGKKQTPATTPRTQQSEQQEPITFPFCFEMEITADEASDQWYATGHLNEAVGSSLILAKVKPNPIEDSAYLVLMKAKDVQGNDVLIPAGDGKLVTKEQVAAVNVPHISGRFTLLGTVYFFHAFSNPSRADANKMVVNFKMKRLMGNRPQNQDTKTTLQAFGVKPTATAPQSPISALLLRTQQPSAPSVTAEGDAVTSSAETAVVKLPF